LNAAASRQRKNLAQNGPISFKIRRHEMANKDYSDLIAWKKAFELALSVYRITSEFPAEERYGITFQMRKACVSIASNIAEGEGRPSAEFRRFLYIALGSLNELETQLLISDALGYLKPTNISDLMAIAAETGRLIHGLMKSLIKSRVTNRSL
jgi:four helix bundle protein